MQSETQDGVFLLENQNSVAQQKARANLTAALFDNVIPKNEILMNLALFVDTPLLAKILTLADIYKRVRHLPGDLVEFGVWRGQNLVLLENMRAMFEPNNFQRRIIGFDTFTGYTEKSSFDKNSLAWQTGSYTTGEDYIKRLEAILELQKTTNYFSDKVPSVELVKGDVCQTVVDKYENSPNFVAFAYFDLGLYEPTKAALMAIKPHLSSGSILLMDELTWDESPGEAIAFKEVFSKDEYEIENAKLFPNKYIVSIK